MVQMRKSPASGSRSRQEERKKKMEKHRSAPAEVVETMTEKDLSNELDGGCGKNAVCAEKDKKSAGEENLDALSQTVGSVVTQENKEHAASLDESLSLTDGSASRVVENDMEVSDSQKKMRGKEHIVYGNDPSQGMSEVAGTEVHVETTGIMNLNPPDGKILKPVESRKAEQKVKNNCNDIFAEGNVSSPVLQFAQDHLAYNEPSLLNAVGMDSARKYFNELSTSDSTNSRVEEEGINLTDGGTTDSMKNHAAPRNHLNSHEVKYYKSRRNKGVDNKGQNKSDQFEPIQGDVPISLQVTPICSSVNNTSLSNIENIIVKENNNEASDNSALTPPSKEEDLSRSADDGVVKNDLSPGVHSNSYTVKSDMSLDVDSCADIVKSDMSHGIDSHSTEVRHAYTRQRKRCRKRRKNGARHNNPEACSSMLTVESSTSANSSSLSVSANSSSLSVGDEVNIVGSSNVETSAGHILMPQVGKENGSLSEGVSANANKSEASLEIVKNPNSNNRKKPRRKKKKVFDSSQFNMDLDRNEPSAGPSLIGTTETQVVSLYDVDASTKNNLIQRVGTEDVDLTMIRDSDSLDRSNSVHVMDPGPCKRERLISVETRDRDKRTNENSGYVSIEVEELKVNPSTTSLQVIISGDADKSSMTSASEKLPTDRSEVVSLPPSPIRGVIDDIASPNLSDKRNNLLNSFREEDINFSFQITDDVSTDGPSVNHSKKACGSSNGVEPQNGKSSIHENDAPDSIYMCNNSERAGLLEEKEVACSTSSYIKEDVAYSEVFEKQEKGHDVVTVSGERAVLACTRKKLLVLDLNGLLADVTIDFRNAQNAHKRVGRKAVFKRPFCDDFLKFCFERFDVGVWSSRRKHNVDDLVDYLMQDMKHKLLFCWGQSKCTDTGFNTVENEHKPLVLKELRKLWNKEEPDLPWEKGEYSPSNTLLVDDSPYKALCNPPHTAIFPHPYCFNDEKDNSLGPGGDLRAYLEGLAIAEDVEKYVQEHPFGQRPITAANPSWMFYLRIIEKIENSSTPT